MAAGCDRKRAFRALLGLASGAGPIAYLLTALRSKVGPWEPQVGSCRDHLAFEGERPCACLWEG